MLTNVHFGIYRDKRSELVGTLGTPRISWRIFWDISCICYTIRIYLLHLWERRLRGGEHVGTDGLEHLGLQASRHPLKVQPIHLPQVPSTVLERVRRVGRHDRVGDRDDVRRGRAHGVGGGQCGHCRP
jgi:hypothetical protein